MNGKIGIDIRMLHHTGIGTYLKELLRSFLKTGAVPADDLSLFGKMESGPEFSRIKTHSFNARIYSISEQLAYPFQLSRCRLWHAPHYNIPVVKGKTRLVVTIHDLIHWVFRKEFFHPVQAFYAGQMFSRAVKNADHIIAVSKNTCDDLIRHFDADPEKISIIYEGVSERFDRIENPESIEAVKKKYRLPKTFFLYVGMLKPHKNVLWLIRLFRELRRQSKIDSLLVIVGRKDLRYPSGFSELANLTSDGDVIHLPYIEGEELTALYSGALALVHPSLYEGFGLTLLEAMACGTPVIACRAGSIPEVVGEGGYLVDSCAQTEMMEALVRMEKIPALRSELSVKGRRQAERFQWAETAKKTAEVYEKVLTAS